MAITVRDMTQDDIVSVARIADASWRDTFGEGWSEQSLAEFI